VLSSEHVIEGDQLQEDVSVFERDLKAIVEDLWREEHGNQAAGTVERPQEAKSRPEKPIFGGDDWKIKLLL
jgi:hypothetical protein